jgi:hypothetical protein
MLVNTDVLPDKAGFVGFMLGGLGVYREIGRA